MKKNKKPISRSENMRRIKSKDTSIEIILRKELWRRGFRYRKNVKDVFGKPDIVFKGKKLAIFTDSEFWHGKQLMEGKYIPKTNTEFWINKITRNIERDKEVNQRLKDSGWIVLRFWETDIYQNLNKCANKVEEAFNRI